ncbi:class I SAM-dependent methyltransferase [Desulfolutivibrio sulfoxidireducens]|uniref:class I SAM-dependent methyltransferase n=1 Tax=Desulfolutivibrio sulfoxidireducens TaxID=2773299 RepID=UPI00159DA1C3|nr:class I SAM-dependent methyltransferase [Desulfolutivibrio sulfoxidireducens]QLA17074.1 methyltransferase domain-containing protein [Desulfolutivibrio sulfoxidireducens]QLA20642.1 methyltransferase domain-containing protein [Desulfolutivibrio sulfoxidireducens]
MISPKRLHDMYKTEGINVMDYLRNNAFGGISESDIIEYSYDFQSGTYIDSLNDKKILDWKMSYAAKISKTILGLCRPSSLLEAGVGEATTLAYVAESLASDIDCYGFDLSWSRAAYASRFLKQKGVAKAKICTGDLLDIPFKNDSIDVVYTSHSIEPNHGNEEPILRELYRVARKFLILLEPGYEFASEDGKRRMEHFRYCRKLKEISLSLGYSVITHELFSSGINPLNPTAITIIQKDCESDEIEGEAWACPKFKCPLIKIENFLYSPEALIAYPILLGIPCLRSVNGIFASKIEEFIS